MSAAQVRRVTHNMSAVSRQLRRLRQRTHVLSHKPNGRMNGVDTRELFMLHLIYLQEILRNIVERQNTQKFR